MEYVYRMSEALSSAWAKFLFGELGARLGGAAKPGGAGHAGRDGAVRGRPR